MSCHKKKITVKHENYSKKISVTISFFLINFPLTETKFKSWNTLFQNNIPKLRMTWSKNLIPPMAGTITGQVTQTRRPVRTSHVLCSKLILVTSGFLQVKTETNANTALKEGSQFQNHPTDWYFPTFRLLDYKGVQIHPAWKVLGRPVIDNEANRLLHVQNVHKLLW